MSEILNADALDIISDNNIPWEELKGSTFLVTGAKGLIGSALVRALKSANEKYVLNIDIIAHARQTHGDIRQGIKIDSDPDYIIHCASITKSKDMVEKPVDVISVSVDGTRNVLELARTHKCKSVVYLSSMEVYGQIYKDEVTEDDLGHIDLANPRSSYPESKRLCESLCTAYFKQFGVPVKIARLARTFGAGVKIDDSRVFAQFAKNAFNGEDIALHTEGKSIGNYCYISDAVKGLFILLLKGASGNIYNISNPDSTMTIREMANLVADQVCNGKIKVVMKVPDDINERGYLHDVGFTLNSDKMKELGWQPKYGLKEMYERMIENWRYKGE